MAAFGDGRLFLCAGQSSQTSCQQTSCIVGVGFDARSCRASGARKADSSVLHTARLLPARGCPHFSVRVGIPLTGHINVESKTPAGLKANMETRSCEENDRT